MANVDKGLKDPLAFKAILFIAAERALLIFGLNVDEAELGNS
jgi:hypothetical protein